MPVGVSSVQTGVPMPTMMKYNNDTWLYTVVEFGQVAMDLILYYTLLILCHNCRFGGQISISYIQ